MAGEWAIVAAAAVGGTLPLGIEWIRERSRIQQAREARQAADLAEQRAQRSQLVDDVLNAWSFSRALQGEINRREARAKEHAAIARLAWHGDAAAASHARGGLVMLSTTGYITDEWINELIVIVAPGP